jgi:hypothetical protein
MTGRLSALWQRNAVGAVVVAAALGVLVAVDFAPQWSSYRRTVDPETVVSKGESGVAIGQTWKLASVRHLSRNPVNYGPALPEGAVLIVVYIDRSGPVRRQVCDGVITDGQRRWKSEGIGGFSPRMPDGATNLCSEPGQLQLTFLMPRDAIPTAVDVVTLDGDIMVRLVL